MLVGPLFRREVLTAPRQLQHYLIRAGYVAALLVLLYTVRQVTIGFQNVTHIGDVAKFGGFVFQILALVQLSLVLFFALLFAANSVAQEKDRETLLMLLMTDLHDRELVLGKLCSSLLLVFVLIASSIPVFCWVHRLGGVSISQIIWLQLLCCVTAIVAGSWGALVAYWREKTFQTLSISLLGVLLLIGVVEAVVAMTGANSSVGAIVGLFNPFRTLFVILSPLSQSAVASSANAVSTSQIGGGTQIAGVAISPAMGSVIALGGLAVLLNTIAIQRLRAWNPSRSVFRKPETTVDSQTGISSTKTRTVWNSPVIWREIRTKAYGQKVVLIKSAYCLLAVLAMWSVWNGGTVAAGEKVLGMISSSGGFFVGLSLLSLLLVNAQAVTSLTSERDMKTLELLLMTDVTAKEFVLGKLGGIFYNTKELILLPLLLLAVMVFQGSMGLENLFYVAIGFLVLVGFTAMLGLHSGFSYDISRNAIANSLGTIFFLFIGIFLFMLLLIETRSSFYLQFQSFILFIGAGSVGLYVSLSQKNPSLALRIAATALPFLTFYSITEFLLDGSMGVCIAVSLAYGFTTLAMLIPSISEFDVALGRTTIDQG